MVWEDTPENVQCNEKSEYRRIFLYYSHFCAHQNRIAFPMVGVSQIHKVSLFQRDVIRIDISWRKWTRIDLHCGLEFAEKVDHGDASLKYTVSFFRMWRV